MKLMIGLGSCGIAAGGLKVKDAFSAMLKDNPGVNLVQRNRLWECALKSPMIELIDDEGIRFTAALPRNSKGNL